MKTNIISQCLKYINIIGANQTNDIIVIDKANVNKILALCGLSINDINKYILAETNYNYYIEKQNNLSATIDQFLDIILSVVKYNLPYYIYTAIKDIPIKISKKLKTCNGKWNGKSIILSEQYISKFMQQGGTSWLMHTIGHEYWHAYSDLNKNKVNQLAIVEHVNFIDSLTDELYNKVDKYYVRDWGKSYISKYALDYLKDKTYKRIDKAIIRGSFEEIMADSLGCIVAGTKNNITNKGINFILDGG